jgi:hypothetical protein
MELIDCKIGVPFKYGGITIVAKLTRTKTGATQVCPSCVFFSRKNDIGQCKHIKECIAFKRPDKKSVIFRMAKQKKERYNG